MYPKDNSANVIGLVLLAFAAVVLMPDVVWAANASGNQMAQSVCGIRDWFSGNLGKGLASLAVVALGIGAMFGKVEWKTAIQLGIGVAAVFGAKAIWDAMFAFTGGVSAPACT